MSTSIAARWVPCGKEKFSGSKVYSESSDGSMPSGKLWLRNVASATSWMVTPFSVPRDREPAAGELEVVLWSASSRCAATTLAFSITLSAHLTTAVPPTGSEREP